MLVCIFVIGMVRNANKSQCYQGSYSSPEQETLLQRIEKQILLLLDVMSTYYGSIQTLKEM